MIKKFYSSHLWYFGIFFMVLNLYVNAHILHNYGNTDVLDKAKFEKLNENNTILKIAKQAELFDANFTYHGSISLTSESIFILLTYVDTLKVN